MNIRVLLSILLLTAIIPASAADMPDSLNQKRQTVGLVLSGGGAKGIGHIGVIRALEDNGIPIDYVAGTSMGAVVGSLYVCGYSPQRMMELVTSPGFHHWSTGIIDRNLEYYYAKPEPAPKWLQINASFRDSLSISTRFLPGSLINPTPMNIEFMRLFAPYSQQCDRDFNKLMVPFCCVASDVYAKHKVVLSRGSLGQSVRASMSFPMVFKPIEIDSVLLFDGGIYDNFPVDVMKERFHPDIIIGVSVSGPDGKPKQNNLYSQLEDMIIQNNNYSLPAEDGIKIQLPVLQFGVLDFDKANEIYDIGYRTGLAMVDSIKKRVYARRAPEEVAAMRRAFADNTPRVVFNDIEVSGCTPGEASYIKYLFNPRHGSKTFDMDTASRGYWMAMSTDKLNGLLPTASPSSPEPYSKLNLLASVKRNWGLGLGGWITSSTNSMLFLSMSYNTLSFKSFDASLSAWVGQSYYALMATARQQLHTSVPSSLELQAVMSRQKYYGTDLLFYKDNTPTFITDNEMYARLRYTIAGGQHAKAYAAAGVAYNRDSYFGANTENFATAKKDNSHYRTAAITFGYDYNTLDNELYPSAGSRFSATLEGVARWSKFRSAESEIYSPYHYNPELRLQALWRKFRSLHHDFKLGVMAQGGMALHKLFQNYTATLVQAPAFAPTPSTRNYFNKAFRADNFLAAGIIPVWVPVNNLQLRGDFYIYLPVRDLRETAGGKAAYRGWFRNPQFLGEIAAVYNFNFASLSIYGNYLSYPARNWNFGVNFGLLFQAPRFLR